MKKSIFIFFLLVLTTLSLTACGKGNGSGDNNGGNDTHVHTFSNEWSNDQTYHWKESTCGHNSTERKEFHDFENNVCKVCAYEKEIPHEHTFASEWSSDETYHWYASTCNHPETEQKIAHEFVDGVCVCGYEQVKEPVIPDEPDTPEVPDEPNVPSEPEIPDEPDVPSEPEHEHTFATEWSSDETYHWYASTCGHNDTIEYIEHDNKDGVCSQCGFDTHKHTFADEWSKDETYHWYASTCGHNDTIEYIEHDNKDGVCSQCGFDTHQHTFASEWSSDETYHWYASTCGHNDTIEYIEHDFENRVCVDCGQEYFSQGLEYKLNEDGESYSVVGIGTCGDLELYIPETYENLSVIKIGDWAFGFNELITKVVMPDSITIIGEGAFGFCYTLTDVENSKNLAEIGYEAFSHTAIEEIVIPEEIKSLNKAFWGCSQLKSIKIPSGVVDIGVEEFYGCASLESINIPNSVISIGESAFQGCSSLKNLIIPQKVTKIENNLFFNCESLINIGLPDDLESIGESAFSGCSSLEKIEIPKTVANNIGKYAFSYCCAEIVLEEGIELTTIGTSTFEYYFGETLIIPNSVVTIGKHAFAGCTANIIWEEGAQISEIGESVFNAYLGKELVIPASVTWVASSAFIYSEIETLTIPKSVKGFSRNSCEYFNPREVIYLGSVSDWVNITFSEDSNYRDSNPLNGAKLYIQDELVENVEISSEVINEYAFYGYAYLKNVVCLENVDTIKVGSFENCSALESIVIPSSVTRIEPNAFRGCSSLTIYCEAESEPDGWCANWNPDNRPVVWGYNSQPEEPEHTHTFATEWSSDETYHWYESTCNHPETEEKIAHEFVDGVCVCGYEQVKEPVIPDEPDTPTEPEIPEEHVHVYEEHWTVDVDSTKYSDGSKSRHCVDYDSCGGKTDEQVIPAWSGDSAWTPNA